MLKLRCPQGKTKATAAKMTYAPSITMLNRVFVNHINNTPVASAPANGLGRRNTASLRYRASLAKPQATLKLWSEERQT